jgi:DnaK suppressor protein
MKDINKYKGLLEIEKEKLLKELASIGRRNSSNPQDWEATATDLDSDSADLNETADMMESLDENKAIVDQLEIQLLQVESALGKIESGTYGKCNVCGEEIPEARLDANPAALTCMEHTK